MDCSECILLIISFCCAGGMSSGLEKTVYGSLGGPTLLNITPELQNFTVQFSDARWKRSASNGGTKTSTFLVSYDGKNYTNYMEKRIKFHPENFSLEILETMRTDAGHYEYTVTKRSEEQSLQFQLEVYERVSVPDIQIVSRILGNESCSMNLSCVVNSGDNVTYSWNCSEGNTSQLHPYNDSFLHLSFTPGEGSVSCSCTARNRVNHQTTRFSSSVECSNKTGGLLRNELLESIVPIAIVGVLVFGAGIACWLRHRGQEEHSQQKEEKESCTIYSQVQRVEQKSSRPPLVVKSSECTTIYVSATGLPPDPAQGGAPDHFKPFQAQEAAAESLPQNLPPLMPPNPGVTTIYDIVMPATSPGNVQNCSRSGDTDGLFPCPQQKPISPAGRTFTHVHAKSHLAPQKRDKTPPCNSGWHNVSHPNRDPRL
ncbi:signaling lymphocytic activation molecule isoform X2 [Mauremys reevesii]|uniref:signaling lymphocytic activation molecule isoform X2 n=1 Tax=Mauremys reevesii TaxID=260615 RepID=UPI00193F8152|nr:signaling lymphocytic activation molecule isoform X2 [Mauremys reevesii]